MPALFPILASAESAAETHGHSFMDLFPTFEEMRKVFDDPQRVHAALVHIPIGAAVLGLLLVLGVVLTGSRASGLRWTTVFVYLIGTLSALWAVQSGEEAEHNLPVKPSTIAHEVLEKHEDLAEYFWVGLASTGALVLISSIRWSWIRPITLLLALIASAGSVAWAGVIGHHGGELVYIHSVGVPSTGAMKEAGGTVTPPDKERDSVKDKDSTSKDKSVEPAAKDAPPKDAPAKDGPEKTGPAKDAPAKDAAPKDAKVIPGERVIPPTNPKDKSTIFNP